MRSGSRPWPTASDTCARQWLTAHRPPPSNGGACSAPLARRALLRALTQMRVGLSGFHALVTWWQYRQVSAAAGATAVLRQEADAQSREGGTRVRGPEPNGDIHPALQDGATQAADPSGLLRNAVMYEERRPPTTRKDAQAARIRELTGDIMCIRDRVRARALPNGYAWNKALVNLIRDTALATTRPESPRRPRRRPGRLPRLGAPVAGAPSLGA